MTSPPGEFLTGYWVDPRHYKVVDSQTAWIRTTRTIPESMWR
jgi:hypothetical protein